VINLGGYSLQSKEQDQAVAAHPRRVQNMAADFEWRIRRSNGRIRHLRDLFCRQKK
jgi:hypothetical protein